MIYSKDDIERILDEVYRRIYCVLPNPTTEELTAIKEVIQGLKDSL